MLKQLSGKKKILAIAAICVVGIAGIAFAASLLLRVDVIRAREIALAASGGGEVVGQEIDREGLWNEYSFHIRNGDTRYEVEIDPFGAVSGLESGPAYGRDWD